MREIKFRGFNRKNGVWLYGFYLQNRGAHFVCPDEFAEGKSWDDYEIDPETRGEYTGMVDRNKREIYEGDIIYDHYSNNRLRVYFTGASFDVEGILEAAYRSLSDVAIDSEVIGNIHDRSATQGDACQSKNPELLEQ
jgi:hypothetical protein